MDKCSPVSLISVGTILAWVTQIWQIVPLTGERGQGSEVHSWTPAPLPQVHVDFAAKVVATEPHHSIHISGMNKRNSISILIICVYIYRKKNHHSISTHGIPYHSGSKCKCHHHFCLLPSFLPKVDRHHNSISQCYSLELNWHSHFENVLDKCLNNNKLSLIQLLTKKSERTEWFTARTIHTPVLFEAVNGDNPDQQRLGEEIRRKRRIGMDNFSLLIFSQCYAHWNTS